MRLKDGSSWSGKVGDAVHLTYRRQGVNVDLNGVIVKAGDDYIMVEGDVAGQKAKTTIFKGDIVAISTVGGNASSAMPANASTGGASSTASTSATADNSGPGVFVLPLGGMVGLEFRHEEIDAIAKEADARGPGQIIVLEIESGGGRADEISAIHDSIVAAKKRHRVVAWIKQAISAAAATAYNCDEIYFMTEGNMGAMTMFAGTKSAQGYQLETWMKFAGQLAEEGGRSKYIAWAMIDDKALLSYSKDPVTGEITWYNDLSGEHVLSDEKTNLVFNATTAMACKFADGVADTGPDLAKLLNIPSWNEVGDGRQMEENWKRLVDQGNHDIPMLAAQLDYKNADQPVDKQISTRISLLEKICSWWDRCRNVAEMHLPPKEELEREITALRKQLADIKKQQQRRGG
ncbi:MAG TPA: hypothetical protein VG711_03490 [Phycisphaerales bacterium]|nr:hypothetical protein [Phycisphaerales bacterium]